MKHLRTVDDVMTRTAICVDHDTAFKDIVETMRKGNVSALPVRTGDGRVAGVVSEADLLLGGRGTGPDRATTAEQLMTRPAVTVTKDAGIPVAARLMARGHLKRLPVVDGDGRLIGVVSRGDLLKVYLRPDADIAAEIRELITRQLVPRGSAVIHVHVAAGVAHLYGSLPDPALADVVVRAARTVPGVVDVEADLAAPAPAV
ncbi:CBS domain-containing protein [Streptomyces antimicrobicus]|uniref:CBS domain-containing protein n=1 Tax=Streptomyces antimicrobicus TaxID=2883108 RepID=A0ABS8B8F5_9ACTN|nr:CBS domain-containing protein [Streptomyces antimicrobicus]MCB5180862.1 CBS domain-containing protein [Streptomyces antimicrobicus]